MTQHDDSKEALSAVLKETRQIQRDRERAKGCEVNALSQEVLSLITAQGGGYSLVSDQDGTGGGLQSTFIVQKEDGQEVNPLLEQYIQQGLKEFRDKKAKTVLEKQRERGIHVEEAPKPEDEFDTLKEAEKQLYAIPEHLRAKESARSDDTISESWLTGIQEVELPMEFKLRNIEETEDAKKQLLDQCAEREALRSTPQFNTRFQRPSGETQLIRTARPVVGQKRGGSQATVGDKAAPANGKQGNATDDATFDRFKKRFRY